MDLFNQSGAEFSSDRKHRYVLWRIWEPNLPRVMFIGLNPSTANEQEDDPTIRRVKSFAANWGYGGVYMTNLFAWVTPYPEDLLECDDPMGENEHWLQQIAGKCDRIIFAWGSFPKAKERAAEVIRQFPEAYALIVNKDGSPRHPLYVPGDVKVIRYHSS